LQFPEGAASCVYLIRVSRDANTNPGAAETKVSVEGEAFIEEYSLKVELCCDVCLTRGPKGHSPEKCPRMTSINKVREQQGYKPISWQNNGWWREDVKVVKSVEVRVEAIEKEVAALKTKVGALENQLKQKQGQKRKAEDPPAGGKPPKVQKGQGGKKVEEPKANAAAASTAEGGDKKKKKRGKKRGPKKAADAV
jgi:hypothetical protein